MRACAVSIATSVLLLSPSIGCRMGRPGEYLAKGNAFFQEGKYRDASLNYRKAVSLDARFGEAHYRLGLAELKQQRPLQAYRALSLAAALMPNKSEAQVALADLGLTAYLSDPRRPKTLHSQVEGLARGLLANDPNSFDGLRLAGSLALGTGNSSEALPYLERAHAARPDHADVVLALTQALSHADRFAEAEQVARGFQQGHPEFLALYEALYLQYAARSRWEDAEKTLRAMADNNPKRETVWLRLAGHYSRKNQRTEMAAALGKLRDNPTDFPRGRMWVGDFYSRIGDPAESLRHYQEGARANPGEAIVYQNRIAGVQTAQGKFDEARKTVDAILRERPEDEEARRRRAFLRLETGGAAERDAALDEWKGLALKNPTDATARFYLGRSYQRKGEGEQALREFGEALRIRRQYLAPRVAMAEIALTQGNPREALRRADEILNIDPAHVRGKILRAAGLLGLGRREEARSELARTLREFPKHREARLQLGLLELAEKRFAEAEAIFAELREPGSEDPRAAAGLAEAYTARNQVDRAMRLLGEEVSQANPSPALRELLAATAVRSGRTELAIEQLRRLIADNPAAVEYRMRLAEVFRLRRDFQAAIEVVDQAQKAAPKDVRPLMLAASIEQEAGNAQRAQMLYRRVLEQRPDDPAVLNNLAFLLAEQGGNLDEALRLAQQAVRVVGNEPSFADTVGWIYLKKKMPDSALQTFDNLVRTHPDNPTYRYHLGAALLEKGQKEKARTELEAALARKPSAQQAARIGELLARSR